MANNYLQFCIQIDLRSDAERDWLRKTVAELREVAEAEDEPETDGSALSELRSAVFYSDIGFQLSIYNEYPNEAYLFAEEGGDPEHLALFLQAFLQALRSEGREHLGFTWAATCSKPRPDEFTGGGVFVKANNIDYFDADGWLAAKIKGE